MFLDKISQNISSFRRNLILGIFVFLIVTPSFFGGEWSKWLQAVIMIAVFLLLFYMVILVRAEATGEVRESENFVKKPSLYLIIFFGAALITSFFSVNKYFSFSLLFLLAAYISIYFSAQYFFRSYQFFRTILNFIFAAGVLAALISLVMYLNQSDQRGMGLLFNANALGSYLLFSLPLGIALFFNYSHKKVKYYYLFGLSVVLAAFILTYSYTGWVSFLIPLIFLLGYYRKKVFQKKNVTAVIILILIGAALLAVFRYQNSHNWTEAVLMYKAVPLSHLAYSFNQRFNFFVSAGEMFLDRPWSGFGYNTFQIVYSRYAHTLVEQPRYAHDYYAQTLAEIGVFGLMALLAFLCLSFKKVYRTIKQEADEERKNLLFGLALGMVGSAIHALFDFGWQFPAVFMLFWLGSGILAAADSSMSGEDQPASKNLRESEPGQKAELWQKVMPAAVILLALILLIRGITLFLGANYFQKGAKAMSDGDYQAGAVAYESGLRYDPDVEELANYANEEVRYSNFLSAGDFNGIEVKMQKALKMNPQYSYAHWVLGRVFFVGKKYTEAEAQYQAAISYNPSFRPDYYYDLAYSYFQQKDYGRSKRIILSILEKYTGIESSSNPNLPVQLAMLNMLLGDNYAAEKNNSQAKIYYEKSLDLQPNLVMVKNKLKDLQ